MFQKFEILKDVMESGNQLGQYLIGVTQTGPDNFEWQLITIKTVFLGIKYDLNISVIFL